MLSGCGGNNASSAAPAPASSAEETTPSEAPAPAPDDSTPAAEPESAAEESALEEAPVEYATMAEKYAAMSHDTNEAYKELEDGVGTEISYPLADGRHPDHVARVLRLHLERPDGFLCRYAHPAHHRGGNRRQHEVH